MQHGDMITCRGCGESTGSRWPETPVPDHCESCPPWECDSCGGMCSMANPCRCIVSLAGMTHADIKALFAASGMGISTRRPSPLPSYEDAVFEGHRDDHEPTWEMSANGTIACSLCGWSRDLT